MPEVYLAVLSTYAELIANKFPRGTPRRGVPLGNCINNFAQLLIPWVHPIFVGWAGCVRPPNKTTLINLQKWNAPCSLCLQCSDLTDVGNSVKTRT